MTVVVCGLSITPVKGTRLHSVERIELEREGVRENRRFFVIDDRARMVNAKQLGGLTEIVAQYSDRDRVLRLMFPDDGAVEAEVRPGELVDTSFYSDTAPARLLDGPFSDALSKHLGHRVQLVEADHEGAVDRGGRGAASLISRASLRRLAEVADEPEVDARRFRMLIELDGVEAHAEDRWVGHIVSVGGARIAVRGHVGRCLITSRHPDTGEIDLPTLDILGSYRRDAQTTEPLPFGIYGEVVRAGPVRVGDQVQLDG